MSGYGSIYDMLYFSGGSRGGAQGDQLSLSQDFEDRPPLPPPPHLIWTSGSAAVFGQKPGNSRLWKEESRLNSTLFRVTKQNPHQTAERLDQ